MGNNVVKRIVFSGMLIAIYVVLKFVSANIGFDIKINIALLPIFFASSVFGVWYGVSVGLLGEFLIQMMQYGFSLTTPLWIIPPAIHGLVIGLFAWKFKKTGKMIYQRPIMFILVGCLSAILVTMANTGVMIIDSKIYGYPYAYVALTTLWRFLIGIASSIIAVLVCIPLDKAIVKNNIAKN